MQAASIRSVDTLTRERVLPNRDRQGAPGASPHGLRAAALVGSWCGAIARMNRCSQQRMHGPRDMNAPNWAARFSGAGLRRAARIRCAPSGERGGCPRSPRRGFTLVELLVTISIIVIVLGVATTSLRGLGESNILANASSTLVTYAGVARMYAIENQVETMLVVNPVNGRLELWHANPPKQGGEWDIVSGGQDLMWLAPPSPPNTDGYIFAPVLDSSAALPIGGDGRPLVAVFPIDFDAVGPGPGFLPLRVDNLAAPNVAAPPQAKFNVDNLCWTAVAFDPHGRLIQRQRRIATRVPDPSDVRIDIWGGAVASNRRENGEPDSQRLPNLNPPGGFPGGALCGPADQYVVDRRDTAITTTVGFIVCDRQKMDSFLSITQPIVTLNPPPLGMLVAPGTGWLPRTRPGNSIGAGDPRDFQNAAIWTLLASEGGREAVKVQG